MHNIIQGAFSRKKIKNLVFSGYGILGLLQMGRREGEEEVAAATCMAAGVGGHRGWRWEVLSMSW